MPADDTYSRYPGLKTGVSTWQSIHRRCLDPTRGILTPGFLWVPKPRFFRAKAQAWSGWQPRHYQRTSQGRIYKLQVSALFFLQCPTKLPVIPNSDKSELAEFWRNEGSPSQRRNLKKMCIETRLQLGVGDNKHIIRALARDFQKSSWNLKKKSKNPCIIKI